LRNGAKGYGATRISGNKKMSNHATGEATLITSATVLLMASFIAIPGARGQQLQLENVPLEGMPSSPAVHLPLSGELLATVEKALQSRDYTRAEQVLVADFERHPKSSTSLVSAGRIFFVDGKFVNCAIAMKKADALSRLKPSDRFTLALAYIALKHQDWARTELEKLASSSPENPLYVYWLGRIDYDSRQFQSAATRFEKVLQLDPHFLKSYDNLGLTYEALGRYDAAIESYEHAVSMNRMQPSPSPWPPLNLAAVLVRTGKLEWAEDCLRESLRYDPRFPKAHYELGVLLEKKRDDANAVRELRESISFNPAYPEPHYALGQIYRRMGDSKQAENEWSKFQNLKQEQHPNPRVQ
jgi:tetratricopeptide (TPR) repeat protein